MLGLELSSRYSFQKGDIGPRFTKIKAQGPTHYRSLGFLVTSGLLPLMKREAILIVFVETGKK